MRAQVCILPLPVAPNVMGMITNILPILATASVLLPSTWRLLKNPTGTGLSLSASLSGTFAMIAWLGYSIHQDLGVSIVSSSLLLVYYLALLGVCHTRGGSRDSLRPFYVLVAAASIATMLGGMTALALVLGLAPIADVPQIRNALRGNVPALSSVAYGLVILRTLPWLPYALEHRDVALGLWVATCTAVNLTMFIVLISKRAARAAAVLEPISVSNSLEAPVDTEILDATEAGELISARR